MEAGKIPKLRVGGFIVALMFMWGQFGPHAQDRRITECNDWQ